MTVPPPSRSVEVLSPGSKIQVSVAPLPRCTKHHTDWYTSATGDPPSETRKSRGISSRGLCLVPFHL